MPRERHTRVLTTLALVAAFVPAAVATQAAAATIHACVKSESGATRIVSAKAKCHKSEHKLSWNTSGPKGPAGANGASGASGAEGKAGANGSGTVFEAVEAETVHLPAHTKTTILSKVLPPGKYALAAKTTLVASSTTKTFTFVVCELEDQPGTEGIGITTTVDATAWASPLGEKGTNEWQADSPLGLEGSLTSSVTTTLSMSCLNVEPQPAEAEVSRMHALAVEAIG
jgi:hypothetical protein